MTPRAARFEAERRKAESELIVIQTLKHLAQYNPMMSARKCRQLYGSWFSDAVREGRLVGSRVGNRIEYSQEDILSLKALELQQAKEMSEDYIL